MNVELTYGQISYSTGDVEESQFAGELEPMLLFSHVAPSLVPIPPGDYRVIDGELFEVVDDLPSEDEELLSTIGDQ